jgi:NitT/TauT family transport system substrate-binding protein
MNLVQNRRSFLAGLSAAGLASPFGLSPARAEAQRPETATVRFADFPNGICTAPQYVAEELLRQDGFTDVRQVPALDSASTPPLFETDRVDFGFDLATAISMNVERGLPVKALAGVHIGCYIVFAHEGINNILDLKGRRVGVGPVPGSDPHVYISAMAAYVGLSPDDIEWVQSDVTPVELFEQGKVDAIMSFPPEAQELRARKLGHVILNSMSDRPWSQYFCCMLVANPAFVQNYPAATKRVVRAVVKAAEICTSDPQRAVRILTDKQYLTDKQNDFAIEALTEIPYRAWRDYDPEDSLRFFALRLHEAGWIKSTPQDVIAAAADWRFLNEIKRELKA